MIREDIARKIAIIRGLIPWESLDGKKVTKEFGHSRINGYASKEGCYEYADQIINLIVDKLTVMGDEGISLALSKQGYTDEVHAELEVVVRAQLQHDKDTIKEIKEEKEQG